MSAWSAIAGVRRSRVDARGGGRAAAGLRRVQPLRDQAGDPERAERALARAHADPRPAPEVVDRARPVRGRGTPRPSAGSRARTRTAGPRRRRRRARCRRAGGPANTSRRAGRGAASSAVVHGASSPSFVDDDVDRLLRHQAVGRELAAHDRHEVVDALVGVIEDRVRPRDRPVAAAAACSAGGLYSGRTPAYARRMRIRGRSGNSFVPSSTSPATSSRRDLVVVRVGDLDVGRPEDRHRVDGDHDVAVARTCGSG